jgi:hypothetical protein
VVTPNYETLFCAGHTIASDGMVVAAGGDMGEGGPGSLLGSRFWGPSCVPPPAGSTAGRAASLALLISLNARLQDA